jgi:hypothetical protein
LVDHFLCYKAGPAKRAVRFRSLERFNREVRLTNQFEPTGKDALLGKTTLFCSAVDKNGEGINDPSAGLTCYSSKPSPSTRRQVISTDQFGALALDVRKRKTQLCVPSEVVGQPTATLSLDHFELFGVKATSSFEKTIVSLEDQFLDENVQLTKPVLLGVPTDKNGEGITSPSAHLTCYSLQAPRFPRRTVEIVNQFGQYRLTLKKPDMLCVPSFKEVVSDD